MGYKRAGQDPARRGQGAGARDPQEDARRRARSSSSTRPSRASPTALSPAAARKRIEGLTLRDVEPAAQRRGRPGLRRGRRQRPAAPRGLRPDRPGPLGLGPRAPRRGARQGSRRTRSGVKTYVLRLTPKEVRDVAVVEARPVAERRRPRASRSRSAPRLRSLGPGDDAGRRVLPRRRQEGQEAGRPPRQRRGRGHVPAPQARPRRRRSTRARSGSAASADPLDFDDVRYFTFKVQPAAKVLVVSDLAIDAEFVADALDPRTRSRPARPGRSRSSRC